MKKYWTGLYFSFPVQLLLLHFRKYQVLLVFWWIMGSAVAGQFMHTYGGDMLFLAPEYRGHVDFFSALFVGMGIGIFVISWNITTFILFSRYFKFLATTSHPFLKYCLNNSLLPLGFLVFYFIRAYSFERYRELMSTVDIAWMLLGFLIGLVLVLIFSFGYFFGANRTILRSMGADSQEGEHFRRYRAWKNEVRGRSSGLLRVDWYFTNLYRLKRPRDVSHYTETFLDQVFKRHHFAAILSILLAFLLLMVVGYCMDNPYFQIPAAASTLIFFSLLIAASAAFVYWMGSWSFPVALILIVGLNLLFEYNILDTRNKLYGLDYSGKTPQPVYSRDSIRALCSPDREAADEASMRVVLDRWKARQGEEKPTLYILNVSGGGTRSATFTFSVLQKLDSLTGGKLMRKTFLISGASGGMLGVTYFRELYRLKQQGKPINLEDSQYVNNISKDLLNPLFSSFVTRDILAPAQSFTVVPYKYVKDRGYAFEEQLNRNTGHILGGRLGDYLEEEAHARLPLTIFCGTVSSDGRKMMFSTQPISFLMRAPDDSAEGVWSDPDAVDFSALFRRQDPMNARLLSIMRVNATFPYVLPNVWLPSRPVIDLMDAGLRDDYGQETTLRFLEVFRDWIRDNTSGVVFIQIRDHKGEDWDNDIASDNFTQFFTRPFLALQYDWPKLQDYSQESLVSMAARGLPFPFQKITFTYSPGEGEPPASLNFHLTTREKEGIRASLESPEVRAAMRNMEGLLRR